MGIARLPGDNHVHSEWSWDTVAGSMEAACERAIKMGVPSVAFTEHWDLTRWVIPPAVKSAMQVHGHLVDDDGRLNPPPLDVEGYFASLETCRARFPDLRIITGVELGEPHWFPSEVRDLLAAGAFERTLGSQHSFLVDGEPWIVSDLDGPSAPPGWSPSDIVRAHLLETIEMIRSCDDFVVLAHVDYAVRHWPAGADRFPYGTFEEEFRAVLGALERSGRILEVNTAIPMSSRIVRWWYEAGGERVSVGSDAHSPEAVARNFADVADMIESVGFRPTPDPYGFWRR